MATNRVKKLVENLPKYGYVMGKAMRGSGYSDSYSHNPHRLKSTKGYNKLMSIELGKIRELREKALMALDGKKPEDEDYKVLVDAVEKYTKLIQLLEGKPTDITVSSVRALTEAELEALVEDDESSEEGTSEEGTGEEEAN